MSDGSVELDPATAVSVGLITAPHGVHGEVKVQPLTDFVERFQAGAVLWIAGVPHRVERGRRQGRGVWLKLAGVDDREAAAALRQQELQVPEATPLRQEGVFYRHDIIGLTVRDIDGDDLGAVTAVLSTGSNDVYVVDGERGQLLLPAIDDVIRAIDLESRLITAELMPGLEFQPRVKPRKPRQKRPRSTGPGR